tara:strand:+ start:294 stop:1658 length:1365 start_codon:yes stop_codon:yes gene_type:complete
VISLKKTQQQTRDLINRGFDRHIRLAVTGLSGAGKTALITGMLEQVLNGYDAKQLAFWQVKHSGRLLGSRLIENRDWSTPRFAYEEAVKVLTSAHPSWPSSTRDVSEIRFEIKYQPRSGLAKHLMDERRLVVELVDYPGEWLLDLPLLQSHYGAWSAQQNQLNQHGERANHFASWYQQAQSQLENGPVSDTTLRELAQGYQQALKSAQAAGFYNLQPGRHLLPGQLEGAPVLAFFPWPFSDQNATQFEHLKRVFERYKEQVIKPFYKNHFQGFNRQVILVDVLTALEQGKARFDELIETLTGLLNSFEYGENALLRRIISPAIDKVALVASKVDHVGPDGQQALNQLLAEMLRRSRQHFQFERIEHELFAVAGIATSKAGRLSDGTVVLDGYLKGNQKVRIGAPAVPTQLPNADQWQQGFEFPQFVPHFSAADSPLPHIRLDQLLEFLLGDKLK